MLLESALLAGLSLASAALTAFSSHPTHRSQAHRRLEPHNGDSVQPDENWAGIVLTGTNGTLTSIQGTFVVPIPSGASGDAAAAWVGIDGNGCGEGLFQAGVDFTVTNDGVAYDRKKVLHVTPRPFSTNLPLLADHEVWSEWYPDWAKTLSGVDIHSGDVITINVTTYSVTSGAVIIENHTTGKKLHEVVTSSYVLCQTAAEWIVEDFEEGPNNVTVPLADFGTVTFVNGVAAGPGGTYQPCNASDLELEVVDMLSVGGQAVTSTTIVGCNVTIKHL